MALRRNEPPMHQSAPDFFDYYCDRCDAPLCERVQLMNPALDHTEAAYCLACLAAEHDMDEPEMARFAFDYIQSRDCFKNPWQAFDASPCPKIQSKTCYCQDALYA